MMTQPEKPEPTAVLSSRSLEADGFITPGQIGFPR